MIIRDNNFVVAASNRIFIYELSLFSFFCFKVYIVGHMPPGSDERQIGIIPNGHTTYSEKNNLRYLRLIRKYSSIIQGQFFGHLHSDSFRIVYNDMGKAFPFSISFLARLSSTTIAFCLVSGFPLSAFSLRRICPIR